MSNNSDKKRCKRLVIAASVGIAACALPISSVYAQIEEIIVIARKTEENLQEIPVSVTAITGDGLENAGITEFPQISLVTPNFDVRADEVRGEFAAVLNIRGQNSTTSDLSIDQAVGININGAPVTRGTNLFGNLFDIEQVEILRGPQGTLFGKNTTGGLVIVTTTAPQLGEFEGYGKLTVGNYGQNDYEGVVNLPLGETAALRLGAAFTNRDGFGEGVRSDGTESGNEVANDDEEFYRASLLIEPNEGLSVRINADYHEVDEAGAMTRALIASAGLPAALPPATDSFYTGSDFNDGLFVPHSDEPTVTADETNVNATIDIDLGFADLTSVTSYRDQDSNTDLNYTPLGGIVIGQDSELIAQELRLSGAKDSLQWQTGFFVSSEEGNDRNNTVGRGDVWATENDSFSVFGQGTFDLTDQLSLTAGARWTEEERAVEMVVAGEVGGSVADYVDANGSTVSESGVTSIILADGTTSFNIANDADFDAVSWTLALDYQATQDMLYYGSISRGFRSGGIDGDGNLASVVEPEFVLNYELGFKGDFMDNALRWNSSLWFSDYTDIQISSFSLTEQISGAAGVPVVVLNNAAEAELYGFESELQWLATDDFSLNATIGYTHGEYSEFLEPRLDDDDEIFQFDRSDEPVGGPEWQYSLTAVYGFDVGADTRGSFQMTYSYIDEQILASPAVIDLVNMRAEESGAVGEDNYGKVNAIGLLNASLNFDIGDQLDVSLWSNNITGKQYFSTGFALEVFGGLAQRTVGAPRQFGATVTYDF